MDRVKNMLDKKVQAATLLEVIISMVLISIVFTISTMIYVNLTDSSVNMAEVKALDLLDKEYLRVKRERKYLDDLYVLNGITIEQKVYNWKFSPFVKMFEMKAYGPNKEVLAFRREIIAIE